jgi:hypothetical protein
VSICGIHLHTSFWRLLVSVRSRIERTAATIEVFVLVIGSASPSSGRFQVSSVENWPKRTDGNGQTLWLVLG